MHRDTIILSIAIGTSAMMVVMALAWVWIGRTKNGGLADVVWTFGLGGVAIFFCFATSGQDISARQFEAAAIIGLWTLRLGQRLSRRNFNEPEDTRYKEFRAKWGTRFMSCLFALLMVQAIVAIVLALGVMLAAHNPEPVNGTDLVANGWMLAALCGSFMADQQLANFKRDPAHRGKICDTGLWSRSRHPNYVFEVMFWAGWPILALSGGWIYGWLGFIAPGFIYWLLRYVSGERMVEELMARHYGEAFTDYCRRVPPFLPQFFS